MPRPNTGGWFVILLCLGGICGCRLFPNHHYKEVITTLPGRDIERAIQLHRKGVKLVEKGEIEGAQCAFQGALLADETFGPAHNNLGLVYFEMRDLYSAAREFQAAIDLMPRAPEPHNNLGLVHESAGHYDEAIKFYQTALDMQPDNAEFLGNLIRTRLRRGESDPTVIAQLRQLLFLETRPDWIDWAEDQVMFLTRALDESCRENSTDGPELPSQEPLEVPPSPLPPISEGSPRQSNQTKGSKPAQATAITQRHDSSVAATKDRMTSSPYRRRFDGSWLGGFFNRLRRQ